MKRLINELLVLATSVLMTIPATAQKPQGQRQGPQMPQKRTSVLITNDLSGDVDGMFALAHQLLCKSVDVRGIVGTHLGDMPAWARGKDEGKSVVDIAVDRANEMLDLLDMHGQIPVVTGAEKGLEAADKPIESPGARMIVEEARKASPEHPLYITCGASLTDIASAWLMDHSISKNVIVVWIGGQEYPFGHPFPEQYNTGRNLVEYNARLDLKAYQTVFNLSDLVLWQIPRDAYRQCLYGMDEIEDKVKPCGKLGEYLAGKVRRFGSETYVLGDSPMVLISSLMTTFEPGAASSFYEDTPAPYITDEGLYDFTRPGRKIRVYTRLDTRLLFGDMESKFRNFAAGKE